MRKRVLYVAIVFILMATARVSDVAFNPLQDFLYGPTTELVERLSKRLLPMLQL